MDKSDTVLTNKIKQGNNQALKKLFDRYHKQLYYMSKHYLKNNELAEDAVQDVYLKLWKKRESLDTSLSIEGLLFTMLKNRVLNMIRDEKNRKKIIEEAKKTVQKEECTSVVEEEIIYSEYEDFLDKAVNNLSPAEKEVFKLRSFEGLSNEEVAVKKNVSTHTVKTQYYLSSKFVRNYLKKHAGLYTAILMQLASYPFIN